MSKWKQLRPFFMKGAVEQVTNDIHTLELYRKDSGSWEIRFEFPNGLTGWGHVDNGNLVGMDIWGVPKYVQARAIKLWRDMESVMK